MDARAKRVALRHFSHDFIKRNVYSDTINGHSLMTLHHFIIVIVHVSFL